MQNVASAVEELILHKPYLTESLLTGIINISALARILQPEVDKMLNRQVKKGAVIMALNRLTDYLQVKEQMQLGKLLNSMGDIILRSNLCDYTFKNTPTLLKRHVEMMKTLLKNDEVFYTLVQGVFETNIVVSDVMTKEIETIFKSETCLFKRGTLSSVTLKLPKANIMQPGFYYSIMKELAWEGINLVEVISSTNEFTVIVDNSLIDKTFIVLKNIGRKKII
ncbi:MAG: aspartate kinase [Culturomica sp.]|jgi:hypothetical protein|nr:aspartate kinase [Culturomica sp.]